MSHEVHREVPGEVRRILELVQAKKLSPEEGRHLLRLHRGGVPAGAAKPAGKAGDSASPLQAVVLERPGQIGSLSLRPVPVDPPAAGEVLIAVRAFSLNFGDLLCVKGLYPTMPDYPFTPGFEVSGTVCQVGEGVERFAPGDDVIALMGLRLGGHGTAVCVPEQFVVAKPEGVSHEEAAAFPIVFVTARYVFDQARMEPGEKVLIQTAAGGVGLMAVQIAQQAGVEIFATAGSEEKLDYLRGLGVEHRINYLEEDFAARIRELTDGYGVDVVLNTLSGDAIQKGLDLLAPGGRYFEIAVNGLLGSRKLSLANLVHNQTFHGVDLRRLFMAREDRVRGTLETMRAALADGSVRPTLSRVFPLPQVREAYAELENRGNIGKVVVRVPEGWFGRVREALSLKPRPGAAVSPSPAGAAAPAASGRIAVVGLACRFPGSASARELWDNLENGRSGIREVPPERWDADAVYDPDPRTPGKTHCRWGGFLDDIDKFDPLFFGISGREAELMDPQQRLFLQESWHALEDAGYANERAANTRCGVFAGVGNSDYQSKLHEAGVDTEAQALLGNETSILPARISYLLNLKGPSVAINTACSSSLVALHLACQSIQSGQCDMALAGGVFTCATPDFHISAAKAGMLSADGRCKTFDADADGFVPGEGVGVVVLKGLEAAERDGDHVYGVILATDTNQDGKTNGITAPSSLAQTAVELSAYAKAGIRPETLGLIEAHGTGTKLGDPVEIDALTEAFRRSTEKTGFCAIGSVKSNIGHTCAAAGVAGLIKVLLSLHHGRIPPTLNFRRANENIDFERTPFYVATSAEPWHRRGDAPRRAALSSFGFSGTNAHVVIEESPRRPAAPAAAAPGPHLFLVSAQTDEALAERLDDLAAWLDGEGRDQPLRDVAFTLHAGRKHLRKRVAIVAGDGGELRAEIRRVRQQGRPSRPRLSTAEAREETRRLSRELGDAASGGLPGVARRETLDELAGLYERGLDLAAEWLFRGGEGRRLSMPTYPFARERYWVAGLPEPAVRAGAPVAEPTPLHPLVTRQVPTADGHRFVFQPRGEEPWVEDHRVGGKAVLAGAVSLELARAAGELARSAEVRRLRGISWRRPLPARAEGGLEIRLTSEGDDLRFEIAAAGEASRPAGASGVLCFAESGAEEGRGGETVDLEAVRARCGETLSAEACYERFLAFGFDYGPAFRAVRELRFHSGGAEGGAEGDAEVLAQLELPEALAGDASRTRLALHPALVDGALQGLVALMPAAGEGERHVPCSLAEVEIRGPLPRLAFAHLARRGETAFDVRLTDAEGTVLVALRGLEVARVPAAGAEVLCYRPFWRPAAAPERTPAETPGPAATLVLDLGGEAAQRLRRQWPDTAVTLAVPGARFRRLAARDYEIDPASAEDWRSLLAALAPEERPRRVLLLWEAGAAPGMPEAVPELGRGFDALLHLSRAWIESRRGETLEILAVYPLDGDHAPPHLAALGALGPTLRLENPGLRLRTLGLPAAPGGGAFDPARHWQHLIGELEGSDAAAVRYGSDGTRRIEDFEELPPRGTGGAVEGTAGPRLREGGVYLVTGGTGGLGLLLARHLARKRAKTVLVGRSALSPAAEAELARLTADGATVVHERADITDRAALDAVLRRVRGRFGGLDGVIHAAGVLRDSFLLHKTAEQAHEVIAPKLEGAIRLDELTRDDELDFLVFFSSVAPLLGSAGQADYAFANAALDELAVAREALRQAGRRRGKTLSIAWPLWTGGGMAVGADREALLHELGLRALEAEEGLEVFERALAFEGPRVAVLAGDPAAVRRAFAAVGGGGGTPGEGPEPSLEAGESAGEDLRPAAETYLTRILAEELRVPAARIDADEPLETYGIDSVMVMSLSRRLEEDFGELPKTLFFEYQTLREVAGYFVERHAGRLGRILGGPGASSEPAANVPADVPAKVPDTSAEQVPGTSAAEVPDTAAGASPKVPDTSTPVAAKVSDTTAKVLDTSTLAARKVPDTSAGSPEAIAVVGVAGRYPMARDLDAFWSNLAQGRDCITEIPSDRWALEGFFEPRAGTPGKSYSKWGGFLDDIDSFDALFFNIAPNEADMMDPQERLFLQTVWHLLEDAGHTRRSLRGLRTGVWVGVMYGHYQLFSAPPSDGRVGVASYASIANRVSYFFDFRGPSLALDTMCSSSLTAIHLACESLRRGECEVAVAGGVNLTVHPRKYVQLSLGRFASSDGRCRSFGEGGDGYVPGEGVGAVLLRPLGAALADGDTIHAVVRGSAVNHGGKTNGYTVPNPHAQSRAILDAMHGAGVGRSQVSYIEAHGTGTALGDPIEIAALNKAFAEPEGEVPGENGGTAAACPIGSVKSSIGHLESAAGIAAVTKVLLQMRHRSLAPSLHAERLNPNIAFADSPFFVQRQLDEWEPPVAGEGHGVRRLPRIAGVSSFGAGGSNAHVILEQVDEAPLPEAGDGPQLLVLSARSREQLQALAGRLAESLERRLGPPAEDWRSRLREDLLSRVSELLGLRDGDLGTDDDLTEAGLDDVARTRLGSLVGEAYGLEWEDASAPEEDTVRTLAERLAEAHPEALRTRFGGGAPAAGPPLPAPRLADVAFTLQVGREAMAQRLAFAAADLAEAVRRLGAFAAGEPPGGSFFAGRIEPGGGGESPSGPAGDGGPEPPQTPLGEGALERIAQRWVGGAEIDWRRLHPSPRRRVSLPGYPFARERHWLPQAEIHDPDMQIEPASHAASHAISDPEPQETPMAPVTSETSAAPQPSDELRTRLARDLVAMASELIGLEPERMDAKINIGDYGLESVALKELADRISSRYGVAFSPTVFFERSNLAGAAGWMLEEAGARIEAFYQEKPAAEAAEAPLPAPAAEPSPPSLPAHPSAAPAPLSAPAAPTAASPGGGPRDPQPERRPGPESGRPAGAPEPVAVIGMSGRFPQSPTPGEFWENLRAERNLVTEIPEERWDWRDYDNDELPEEERCKFHWGGFIDDADKFDARFFGIAPGEAEMMDPQQRVFLETVWEALEDAGYRPSSLAGSDVGLFAGVQFSDYQHLLQEAGILNAQSGLGNEHSIVLNRISFLLDLHGPSEPANTACSSSLVAIHRAVRSLREGESSMAVAGGISLNLSPNSTISAGLMGILSPEGKCKTLARGANGYVKGEGSGAVVLKPLSRAMADGDHIYAVIRGTAVNHGGRAASLTAPNSQAQAALIRTAVDEAGVGPETLGYIELHGTGTELGDPVEINGLKAAFRRLAQERGVELPQRPTCGLGSVKTNIGHLEPAAGIAGLIKVILAMQHQTLPKILHLEELNPYVDLDGTPFFVVDETRPWQRIEDGAGRALPLRAGVSSFGFGGVNAHVVLEEFVAAPLPPAPAEDRLFVFSAKSEEALAETVRRFLGRLESWERGGAAPDPADVAFTLHSGREEMEERLAVVARDLGELRQRLEAWSRGEGGGERVERGRITGAAREAPETADLPLLARHWVYGGRVEWSRLSTGGRPPRRVSLPAYPFERKRHWFKMPEGAPALRRGAGGAAPARVEIEEEILFGKQFVVAELKEILADKIKVDPEEVDENVDLQEFGIDSMVSGMIMQAAQEKFNAQVPLNAIVEHPTLSSLAEYIYEEFLADDELPGERRVHRRKRSAEEGSGEGGKKKRVHFPPELLPIQTKGSGQASFWVHGAAGYSAWFQNLSEALGPEFPIYAFQARGTDGFSMPHTLEEMVDHYVHCMRLVQPEGPYVIGGYSFGGLIAMEMARKLHEEGETIRHLIMFDTYPATQEVFDRHFGKYDDDFLQFYLANYFLRIHENPELAIRQQDVAHLPERLRLAELAKQVKERGQTRISADEIYKYLRGGLVCSEHAEGIYQMYPMRPYDASDMLFFKATDGFTGKASAVYWESRDILAGYDYPGVWNEYVAGEVQVVELDSDHLNMLEEPTLTPAARHIEALLREPPPFDMGEYLGFKEAFDQVTRFGHELLAARFRGSGALPEVGEGFRRADLHQKLAVLPEYGRLFHASVDILEREGFVRREGDRLVVTPELEKAPFAGGEEEIAARIGALTAEHPEIKDYLPLLRVCQGAVLEVMDGSREATDVMFPGGSMKYVAELYKGNLQTDFYNRLVAERVQEVVRHHARRYPHSKVQLFEVGAGTGGTSVFIFQALAQYADKLRYIYTDIGSAFLQMSKQQFGAQYPYIDFLHFDVEKPPEAQGFEPHSMDVVIASNVLHTTHHIDVTLRTCAQLLKPGGVIVINELTQRLDYNTLTFGLTTGWWLYEDEEVRIQGSPLLTNVDWARMLKKAGFGEVEIVGVPGIDANDLPQSMIAATKQAQTPGSGEPPAREAAETPAAQTAAAQTQGAGPQDLVAVEGRAAGERAGERAAEEGEAG